MVLVAACFYYTGCVAIARWWRQRGKPCVVVLNYHRASGGYLREHLLYLRRYYPVMHLDEALDGYAQSLRQKNRRTVLVITFDDGYADNYTHGLALARALEMPITVFLVPGYIESGDRFWWFEGRYLVEHTQVEKAVLGEKVYHLQQPEERKDLELAIDKRLRYAATVAERQAFLAQVREMLGVPGPALPRVDAERPLSWDEVAEMEASGWVLFGAHTMHHPILSYLTDHEELRREVQECRAVLEQRLGHPVRTFAYPVGQQQHIGEHVIQAVQQAGYTWAFTTVSGINTQQSDRYLLRRVEADVTQHPLVLAAEVAGLWSFFARLRWLPVVRAYLARHA
jgi:peptidoglycan/xylan/chitin deacetylase (PgdA/CDA1 family)